MTAPTPEQRATWREDAQSWVDAADPLPGIGERILVLLDALEAEEQKAGRLAQQLGNIAADKDDARLAVARARSLAEKWKRYFSDNYWYVTCADDVLRELDGGKP